MDLIRALHRDERGIILKHIIKIGIVVVVLVFLMVELGPILWLRFSTMQDAEDVATAAARDYRMHTNIDQALKAAGEKLQTMGYSDDEIKECSLVFLPEGSQEKTKVKATVVKYANTLLLRHIGPLKKYSRVATSREAEIYSPEDQ